MRINSYLIRSKSQGISDTYSIGILRILLDSDSQFRIIGNSQSDTLSCTFSVPVAACTFDTWGTDRNSSPLVSTARSTHACRARAPRGASACVGATVAWNCAAEVSCLSGYPLCTVVALGVLSVLQFRVPSPLFRLRGGVGTAGGVRA